MSVSSGGTGLYLAGGIWGNRRKSSGYLVEGKETSCLVTFFIKYLILKILEHFALPPPGRFSFLNKRSFD